MLPKYGQLATCCFFTFCHWKQWSTNIHSSILFYSKCFFAHYFHQSPSNIPNTNNSNNNTNNNNKYSLNSAGNRTTYPQSESDSTTQFKAASRAISQKHHCFITSGLKYFTGRNYLKPCWHIKSYVNTQMFPWWAPKSWTHVKQLTWFSSADSF